MSDFIEKSDLGIKESKTNKRGVTTHKLENGIIQVTKNKKGAITKLQVGKHKLLIGGLSDSEIIDSIKQALGVKTDSNFKLSARDLKQLMNVDKDLNDSLLQREKDLTKGSGKFVLYSANKKKFLSEKMGLTKDNLKIKIFDSREDAFLESDDEESLIDFDVVEI